MVGLYAFVLAGTLFHAASNVWQKQLLNQGAHPRYVTVVWMAGASLIGFTGSFLLHGIPQITSGTWYLLFLTAAILNTFIMHFDVKSRKLEDVSVVAPISSIAPLVSVPIAIVLLGEWTTFWGFLGILAVVPGLYLIGLSGKVMPLPAGLERALPESWSKPVGRWIGPWLRLAASRGGRG